MSHAIRTLVNLNHLCKPKDYDIELLSQLQHAYNSSSADPDVKAQTMSVIARGSEDPQVICQTAKDWNQKIQTRLRRMIDLVNATGDQLDTLETYNLVKAAMAANNEMHLMADELLLNMPTQYDPEVTDFCFSTVIKDWALADIQARPENYILVELAVD